MTNEQFRRILYAIIRYSDMRAPSSMALETIRNECNNALEVLSREADTALTVEKRKCYMSQ